MKAVYTLMVMVLVAGLALTGCKNHKAHAAGDACCATEKPATATPAAQ